MHPNPIFRQTDSEQALALVRARGFGILSLSADPVPLLAHVPFLVSDDGATVDLHLTRSNPITRALGAPTQALLAVSGPDGYVSPDWYELEGQVPTWNYAAVHLVGRLETRPDAEMPGLLDRLSDHFEARLAPKPIWKTAKLDPEAQARMMRMIVPFRFHIDEIRSTFKLSQNKPEAARLAAAQALGQTGFGQDHAGLAALMRDPPKS